MSKPVESRVITSLGARGEPLPVIRSDASVYATHPMLLVLDPKRGVVLEFIRRLLLRDT